MFSALKKLFNKSGASKPDSPQTAAAPSKEKGFAPLAQTPTQIADAAQPQATSGEAIVVPLAAVIQQLPKEVYGRLAPAGVGGRSFTIPRAKAIAQLQSGSVKVSFGELRRGAPDGVFVTNNAHDSRLVDLPLNHILSQLRPEDYPKRRQQRRVEVPNDVTDIFGLKGEPLAEVRLLSKDELTKAATTSTHKAPSTAPPSPQQAPAPVPPPAVPPAPAPAVPAFRAPAPTAPASAVPRPATPAPLAPPNMIPFPTPATPGAAVQALRAQAQNEERELAKPPPEPPAPKGDETFFIPLEALAQGWPEPIRQEIARLKTPHTRCALPAAEVCEALKQRKLQYTWSQIRSRIRPVPALAGPSPHAATVLDLPLDVVTPLFLEFIRSVSGDQQVASAEHITEFFRKAQQAPAPIPAAPVLPVPPSPPMAAPTPRVVAQPTPKLPTAPAERGSLTVPLSLVSQSWPEHLRKEIERLLSADTKLEVPLIAIENGLKTGRIEFVWKQVSQWLKPAPPEGQESTSADTRLSLPLDVLVPLYMRYLQQRPPPAQAKKPPVDAEIPDLFSPEGKLQAATPSAPAPAPAVSAATPRPAVTPTPPAPTRAPASIPAPAPLAVPVQTPSPAESKSPGNLAELFGEPEKRNWTPNDIVQKTVQLPGVAGALIALQDGLLVAGCMPPDLNTETIAAFLPQIAGRMHQYAKEFKMGALKSVTFTVENGVLQIYNPGIIYFAVLGRPGATLPLESVNLIAAELSRHTK